MRAKQCLCIINHRLLGENVAADRFKAVVLSLLI